MFESEINKAINVTDENYSNMDFRAAIKTGFFDLQVTLKSVDYVSHMPYVIVFVM